MARLKYYQYKEMDEVALNKKSAQRKFEQRLGLAVPLKDITIYKGDFEFECAACEGKVSGTGKGGRIVQGDKCPHCGIVLL